MSTSDLELRTASSPISDTSFSILASEHQTKKHLRHRARHQDDTSNRPVKSSFVGIKKPVGNSTAFTCGLICPVFIRARNCVAKLVTIFNDEIKTECVAGAYFLASPSLCTNECARK